MSVEERKNQTKREICEYLAQGMSKKDSAVMAGIDESTFYRWLEKDASFASQVQISILKYKHSLIQSINTNAARSASVALQILRTRWPEEWDPIFIARSEGNDGHAKRTQELQDIVQLILGQATEEELTRLGVQN